MPSLPSTDAWVVAAGAGPGAGDGDGNQLASPANTPTKRASRASRISNDVDYAAFTRTNEAATVEFRIGDTVIVDETPRLGQKFLAPPSYLMKKRREKPAKGKRKADAAGATEEEEAESCWKHEDGLGAGDKVAVVTRLFGDERGRMMALVRWFARPGAVWGSEGPDQDDEAGQVLPVRTVPRTSSAHSLPLSLPEHSCLQYELYFTSDSNHLSEARILREKAAANPFSSPSASPTKRSRQSAQVASPSRFGASAASRLSSAAHFRTPQHSDPIPLSAIVSHAEVFSPSSLPDPANPVITASQQRPIPTFLCRKIYDVKPIPGAGFWGDVDWDDHRQLAIQWYHRRMETKDLSRATDGWNVEAVMEESEEEDSEDERRRQKRRDAAAKARASNRAKRLAEKGSRSTAKEDAPSDASVEEDASDSGFVGVHSVSARSPDADQSGPCRAPSLTSPPKTMISMLTTRTTTLPVHRPRARRNAHYKSRRPRRRPGNEAAAIRAESLAWSSGGRRQPRPRFKSASRNPPRLALRTTRSPRFCNPPTWRP